MTCPVNVLIEDPQSVSGWLALQARSEGLELTADTLANSATQMRRVTAQNVYVPGTYTLRAVKDNSTETIGVRVYADDRSDHLLEAKVAYLVELFVRPFYTLMVKHEAWAYVMTGQSADHVINRQREYRHAGVVECVFSVPVLPYRKEVPA